MDRLFDETVGERIRSLRISNKLNQVEFSKIIGITQGALSEIEKSNTKPSIDTVLSISRHFKVTTDWIIKGDN